MQQQSKLTWQLVLITAGMVVAVSCLASFAWLRPIADDYCTGFMVSAKGITGTLISWYFGHSAYLVPNWLSAVLVGYPVAFLNFGLAGTISIIATAVATGIAVMCLLAEKRIESRIAVMAIGFCSWVYGLSVSSLRSGDSLTESFIHWQTINAAYLVPVALIVCLVTVTWRSGNERPNNDSGINAQFFVGLVAGLTSLVVSLGFTVFSIVKGYYEQQSSLSIGAWKLRFRRTWLAAKESLTGVLIGSIIANLSPGMFSRLGAGLGSSGNSQVHTFNGFLATVLKGPIKELAYNIAGPMILLSLATGILVGFYFSEWLKPAKTISLGSLILITSGIIIEIISGFVEYLTYDAHWHMSYSFYLIWLGMLLLGAYTGRRLTGLARKTAHSYKNMWGVLILVIYLSVVSRGSSNLHDSLRARALLWEKGPAQVAGASDIEERWVRSCWDSIRKAKRLGKRMTQSQ